MSLCKSPYKVDLRSVGGRKNPLDARSPKPAREVALKEVLSPAMYVFRLVEVEMFGEGLLNPAMYLTYPGI